MIAQSLLLTWCISWTLCRNEMSKLLCCSGLKCTVFNSVPAGWTVSLLAISWTQKKSELKCEYLRVILNCFTIIIINISIIITTKTIVLFDK